MEPLVRSWDASPSDYDLVVAVEESVDPTFGDSAASLAAGDAALTENGRTVARSLASGDRPVGHAAARQLSTAVDGRTFLMRVAVASGHRRRRVGTLLHEHVVSSLANDAPTLFAYVPGDSGSIEFARHLGYREEGRMIESTVDPRTVAARPTPEGVRLEPLSRLVHETPDWFERLYDMFTVAVSDAPFPIEERPTPPDAYRTRVIDSPTADLDAILIATDGADWVGFTTLRPSAADPARWSQTLTGVTPSHRGHGVATALKRQGLRVVAREGATSVGTMNREENIAIRTSNERLGFEPTRTIHLMINRLIAPVLA